MESGWNRPGEASKVAPKKKPSAMRGIVAFLVLVAMAGGAAWYLLTPDAAKRSDRGETKTQLIEDVGKVMTNKVAEAKKPKKFGEYDERFFDPWGRPRSECYRDKDGVLRYKNGNARAYDPKRPAREIRLPQADEKPLPFEFMSEREIARFIVIPPGETMIGEREYNDAFVADFRKSLEAPIIVTKDDDEEDAELKRAMIEIKKEILARERAGEDIKDILEANRKEHQRMGQFKRDLEHELVALTKNENVTEADLEDFVAAANKMLESKGLKPFENTAYLKMSLRHNIRARRRLQNE